MCFLEGMLLLFSLVTSGAITYFISYSNNNYYFLFLNLIFIPVFYILYLAIYCLYIVIITKNKKGDKYSKYFDHVVMNIDVILLRLLKIKVVVTNKEIMPKDEKCLIVANHCSNFDPLVLIRTLSSPLSCVTKPETFKFPFVGNLIKACGYIPINRDDPREGAKAIFKAKDLLKNEIANVLIFPEGTRNKTDNTLLEMHPGSFKPAKVSGKKVVVCSVKGTKHLKFKLFGKRQKVFVDFIKVLDSNEYESTVQMKDESYNLIYNNLIK